MKNRLKQAGYEIERNLLFGLLRDYGNFKKINKYVEVSDFNCDEYKNIYLLIQSLYGSNNFKKIDKSTLKTIGLEKGLSANDMFMLESFLDVSNGIEVDFEGTYSLFRKINGMRKLFNIAQQHGGIENMLFDIYNEAKDADTVKNNLERLAKSCFKEYKSSSRMVDMSKGMLEYVQNHMFANEGKSIPFSKQFFFLQQYSKGIHVGVTFWGGFSGTGKSTTVIPIFCIPILESGQKLLSIHNEQDEMEIRQLYLFAYIAMVKKDTKGIFRQNMNYEGRNKFSQEQYDYLCQCAVEFEKRYEGRLEFVFTPRFAEDDLENLIEEYNRLGYKNVLLDTFKQEDSTNGWEGMDNMAKRMDGLSKDLELKIVCTVQLAQHMSWRKYLTASCISKAKSIKEVATSFYMFRWLRPEEIPNIKYSHFVKDQSTSNYHWISEQLPLDYIDQYGQRRPKNYIALFNDKQRKSECGQIILIEADLGRMYFKEIGTTTSIKNDDNGR